MVLNVAKNDADTLTFCRNYGQEDFLSGSYSDKHQKCPEHQEVKYMSLISWTTLHSLDYRHGPDMSGLLPLPLPQWILETSVLGKCGYVRMFFS